MNDEFLNDPKRWFNEANLLKGIADDIYSRFRKEMHDGEPGWAMVHNVFGSELENIGPYGLIGPYKMTIGLAIENMAKGMLIRLNGKFDINRWAITKKGHDLKYLIGDELNLSLSIVEGDVLNDLSAYVEWAGRYPAPKNPKRLQDLLPKGHSWAFRLFDTEDMAHTENLYLRLQSEQKSLK